MAEYASAVIAAAGKFPGGINMQDSRSNPYYEQQQQPPQTMVAPRRSTERGNRTSPHKHHQRQEDILREKIYEQQARMTHGRQCICDLGPVCKTISAHFAVLKDPRGKFVVLPSSQSPLRAAYCQYLCPEDDASGGNTDDDDDDASAYDPASVNNDDDVVSVYSDYENEDKELDDQDSSNDDASTESNEGFYVAVHHFYPKVVEKYFGIKKDKKIIRPDHDLLPFPTTTMTVSQRRACGIRGSRHDLQDRVMSHQLTASNNIYWIVPSYSLDKTRVDLEKATRRYLRKKSRGRRRRRSKSAKRRTAKNNHHHQQNPPVQEIGGHHDDRSMTDRSETSFSTWGDDHSMQSSVHGEPFLPLEKASSQDGPLVSPESKDGAKDDVVVDSDETVPNPEAVEEKSDSDTAETSCDENNEKSEDYAPVESIETQVEISEKPGVFESKPAVVSPRRSIALRLVISFLCIFSAGYLAMEFSYYSGVLKPDQTPEMLQLIRAKTKPVEEQIVASLEVQGRRLQSRTVHVATVDLPIWKESAENHMYKTAAPSMRSLRSYLLITVTVKAPQFLQILTSEAESTWTRLQPAFVSFLESSKSQWITFATVDGPRYLSQASVGIQKAGNHVLQASAPLMSSLQEKATSVLTTEVGVSATKGEEAPGANESICGADRNEE